MIIFYAHYTFCFYFFISYFFLSLLLLVTSFEHYLILLIFLDVLLLSNILILLLYTVIFQSALGYIYALLLLGVAATDTALGLGLFILYFKSTGRVSVILD
jgi:NADH:ubiquinone oxidoreductase subunit K